MKYMFWNSHYFTIVILYTFSACNCNLHARKCRFNMELYTLSGFKSGGVCIKCRHNTAGRNCHYCREGFYRDIKKPITHRRVCKGMLWLRHFNQLSLFCLAACNCNMHARRCRFNRELYILSGRKSGGVCLRCKHNTAGRHCHYCKQGYYKHPRLAMSNRKVCKGMVTMVTRFRVRS